MASKGTDTANRGQKNKRPRNRFEGNYFNCRREGRHHAEDCRSAKKKIEKSGDAAADKKSGGRGKCYVCGSKKHFAHKHCVSCRNREHRTRNYEKRGAKKGTMLAKMNATANFEVRMVAATVGAGRGHGKEEQDSGSGASFHISHTQAGMSALKKVPARVTVEVTDGTILLVGGFVTVDVPWNLENKTQEAPSDYKEETKYVAGLAAGSMD